jgi:hypothetical protein
MKHDPGNIGVSYSVQLGGGFDMSGVQWSRYQRSYVT